MKRSMFSILSVLAITTALIPSAIALSGRTVPNDHHSAPSHQIAAKPERSGTFVTVEPKHPTKGTVRVVKEGNKHFLEFDNQFSTVRGPDVTVVLHKANNVGLKLNENDYLTLAPLTNLTGTQRYEIPAGTNLSEYESVVIWCRQFNVTFGSADI